MPVDNSIAKGKTNRRDVTNEWHKIDTWIAQTSTNKTLLLCFLLVLSLLC